MNLLLRRYWYYKLKDSPYQPLFSSVKKGEFVSLDCETTSLDPKRAELVTIAATKIIDNRILTSQPFEVRLCAPSSLNSDSVKVHQIRHSDLEDGIEEKQALQQLIAFIGNRPLVGYHIRYDKKILDLACLRHLGFPLPNPVIEVSQIYHDKLEKHLPNAYFDLSLEAICQHLDLPLQNKHDALQDAITAALVFVRLTRGSSPNFHFPYRR
ncbi:3'-5' exonuclease [Vibrio ostreicida]|uniref:3'-5' exonuclease n=2 Tax=Vibrio ostreicida TaxID=526588 RepID=A0ABT8BPG7_9VIBR|nr:3'-5' exonuclease [Vibrio ostreicida]MDN3608823.1 3'-5' exonuclease [Vibrio ostreicida]NPD10920.1 3'-5' exonuclease [Vibrio ostreicida]